MNKTHLLVATAALLALMTSLASTSLVHAQTPDFNIAAAPLDICVSPGEAASYLVTVSSTDGFQGNVELADSIDPNATNAPTLSPIPSSVSLTSGQSVTFTLTASTVQATLEQDYAITIIGRTDVSVQSAKVYLTVRPACASVELSAPTGVRRYPWHVCYRSPLDRPQPRRLSPKRWRLPRL